MVVYDEDRELYGLLTQRCWDNFMVDSECQKALLAKVLGYLLILGSVTIKAPQIAKIVGAKSVAGLSAFSFYTDVVIYITNAVYHLVNGSPFSAYGEIMTILVQNVYLVMLMWRYMDNRPSPLGISTLVAMFVGTAVGCALLPPNLMALLPLTNLPLMFGSKLPQIMTNFSNGHTGQLATFTVMLNFLGSSARVLTTIQEVGWDMSLIAVYFLSSLLNGIIVLQVVLYWNRTAEWSLKQAEKKKA